MPSPSELKIIQNRERAAERRQRQRNHTRRIRKQEARQRVVMGDKVKEVTHQLRKVLTKRIKTPILNDRLTTGRCLYFNTTAFDFLRSYEGEVLLIALAGKYGAKFDTPRSEFFSRHVNGHRVSHSISVRPDPETLYPENPDSSNGP